MAETLKENSPTQRSVNINLTFNHKTKLDTSIFWYFCIGSFNDFMKIVQNSFFPCLLTHKSVMQINIHDTGLL